MPQINHLCNVSGSWSQFSVDRAKAQEEKRRNRLEYKNFFEICGFFKVDTLWQKVKDRLEDDERCSRLEKIDQLEIFQEFGVAMMKENV
ncbi:hypothetical protein L1887_14614 [Cichorium endivia]|nr:hypothetical protein L1887_14614 [Cichorium endivia]